jgi:hypothetical protein
VELITSIRETMAQQNIIIESVRTDLAVIKAEQQYLKSQKAERQETIGSLQAQLDVHSLSPSSSLS